MRSRLIWKRSSPTQNVVVKSDNMSNRLLDQAIEELVEGEWARQFDEAARRGATYFDSETYRLNDVVEHGNDVGLHMAMSWYRYHAAMKMLHRHPQITEAHADRQLIVDSLVRSREGDIVLHTVDKVVERETYLIGGSCSKARMPIETAADFSVYALDRVDAVLGLQPEERSIGPLGSIVQNEIGCVHLIYDVAATLTSPEILKRFHPGPVTVALEIIPAVEFAEWTTRAKGYMRVIGHII